MQRSENLKKNCSCRKNKLTRIFLSLARSSTCPLWVSCADMYMVFIVLLLNQYTVHYKSDFVSFAIHGLFQVLVPFCLPFSQTRQSWTPKVNQWVQTRTWQSVCEDLMFLWNGVVLTLRIPVHVRGCRTQNLLLGFDVILHSLSCTGPLLCSSWRCCMSLSRWHLCVVLAVEGHHGPLQEAMEECTL